VSLSRTDQWTKYTVFGGKILLSLSLFFLGVTTKPINWDPRNYLGPLPAYLELAHCSPSREFRNCHKLLAVLRQTELPGTTALPISFLCDSFAELIEEMELLKWDDATGDFWSRLAKALQQSNTVKWAGQLDSRLASAHTTGKLSWAAVTRSIRECKMRFERIGGSRLDTDSEVWGLDQTTWELKGAGEASMQKSIPALRQAGCERFSHLPRIQQSYREKAFVVIPPAMRERLFLLHNRTDLRCRIAL